ncbi:MAG: hypothetical protein HKN57_02455 [Xanthomonadales bacterium]|nr:hypothetical protein [Gammaproteobacteria bacterium]MBT8053181.1 hypothetical protein [Gammaproteobacteria bacterium]NND56089.1 hypothetical protein [Xanthomonadales bacterium]NNK50220.1 hypothetical protein [Xanthomonadales bacterium]
MTQTHITLLVEDLKSMVAAIDEPHRFAALEQVFAKGDACNLPADTPNHLRFSLFGIETVGELPVAALTHVSDRSRARQKSYYWLRSDPVTLWADMAQVFMTSYGFADLDPYERNEIENCIRTVLMEEGIDFHSDHPERWCIALNKPLEFEFTPLDEALGMDVADALPTHPEARFWKRILNEIQVALHHCPVNIRRRQRGKQEINSVWFWGGGFLPDTVAHNVIDTVYSNNPVTRGLAIINDCRLKKQNMAGVGNFSRDGRSVLIDWIPASLYAVEELEHLEILCGQLLQLVDRNQAELILYDGSGYGKHYDRSARRRFWRRKQALNSVLSSPAGA